MPDRLVRASCLGRWRGRTVSDRPTTFNDSQQGGEFVQLLTLHQPDIYAYLRSLVFVPDEVAEILQETNLVLWEKRAEFVLGTNFLAWAFQIARYKLLQHQSQRQRKHVCFSESFIDELALQAADSLDADLDLAGDLRRCLAALPPKDRELIIKRYSHSASCESLAQIVGRPVRWVYKALSRIRHELLNCVTRSSNTRRSP